MLKLLKNNKAQSIMGEYVLVLFLVMGMVAAMTLYFKRAIQARIYDAQVYMLREVRERTGPDKKYFNDALFFEYEPYYTNTSMMITRDSYSKTRLTKGASTGVFNKIINEVMRIETRSLTAPPTEVKLTLPSG